jgi:hypothetical protein
MIGRRLLIAGLATTAAAPVLAQDGQFDYRGFHVDLSRVQARKRRTLEDSIRRQIDIVANLNIKPAAAAFFRSLAVTIDPGTRSPGHAGKGGLTLNDDEMPPDNPVLLHEMLHMYHARVLPGGMQNRDVERFYRQAGTAGWRPDEYMLKNPSEFFAMCASVALFGSASRPPSTAAELRKRMPDFHDWIVREFELSVVEAPYVLPSGRRRRE